MTDSPETHLGADDESARRVASLYLRFVNARQPIPTREIYRDFYPHASLSTAKRAFRRDRTSLALCGLVVRDVHKVSGEEAFWQVDEERSYAKQSQLSPADARVLDALCLPFAQDPSFPLRSDLRSALAKIDSSFSEPTPAAPTPALPEDKVLTTINRCFASRRPVLLNYQDAQGRLSSRVVNIYGTFGLRGQTYFVAAEEPKDAKDSPYPPRTYRLDRIVSAQACGTAAQTYTIPEDFSVSDYRLLPFQLGEPSCTLRILVPPEAFSDLQALRQHSGKLEQATKKDIAPFQQLFRGASWHVWTVAAADPTLAGSWCVGVGVIPLAPAECVESWKKTLEEAAHARS